MPLNTRVILVILSLGILITLGLHVLNYLSVDESSAGIYEVYEPYDMEISSVKGRNYISWGELKYYRVLAEAKEAYIDSGFLLKGID